MFVAKPLFQTLLNGTDLAEAVGFKQGQTGTLNAGDQMMSAIAYSAIDQGARVFGDTGIRALFDDATELGEVFPGTTTAAYLKNEKVDQTISKIIAEYAGLLANNKDSVTVATTGNLGHEKGALYYDGSARLVADLGHDFWQITDGPKNGQSDFQKKYYPDGMKQDHCLDKPDWLSRAPVAQMPWSLSLTMRK